MLPILAKAMIPAVTLFITAVSVFQGVEFIKGKLKKMEEEQELDKEYV